MNKNIPPQVERDHEDLQALWTAEEMHLFDDMRLIEQSNMNFVEKKYYMFVVTFLFRHTNYYIDHESARTLLWDKKSIA